MIVPVILLGSFKAMAESILPEARYASIPQRNVFALQPAAHPVSVAKVVETKPVAEIRVAGLTDLGGRRRALLEICEAGHAPARSIIEEGQLSGGIRVLCVDLERGEVRLAMDGRERICRLEFGKTERRGAAEVSSIPR